MNCSSLLNVGSQIVAHASNGMTSPGPTILLLTLVSDRARSSRPFFFLRYLDNLSNLMSSKTGVYIVLYADDIIITNVPVRQGS